MNDIDKKILDRIERAKKILGIEITNVSNAEIIISAANLTVRVAEMIEREENDV